MRDYGIPLTRYQARILGRWSLVAGVLLLAIIITGNIITFLTSEHVTLPGESYRVVRGVPLFTDHEAYVDLVSNYPHQLTPGIRTYTTVRGDTPWSLSERFNLDLDTLAGCNPALEDLFVPEGTPVVIPPEKGFILAMDSAGDISEYKNMEGVDPPSFRSFPFRLIRKDELLLVFVPGEKPVRLHPSTRRLLAFHNRFHEPVRGFFTSQYGDRVESTHHGMKYHNGLDICAPLGSPIKASAAGYVMFAGWRSGYGHTITLLHGDGYTSMYGHCHRILVEKGEYVEQGETIGLVGSTGWSTGPHLHFVITRQNRDLNPLLFIW
jgi:hypothetical protein